MWIIKGGLHLKAYIYVPCDHPQIGYINQLLPHALLLHGCNSSNMSLIHTTATLKETTKTFCEMEKKGDIGIHEKAHKQGT